ncbi:hd phosphohydrolase domain-containing protein [Moniliophthora roreri MCA 2997]|uniref:Hd phosphohydrolase domain-containing protein n=1 Tax=Moniliophthora roreri (strain MCA 2997) TaxID=1381753 RepID=V2XF63_MONRO|nr:hd phosphohydrolase domain-containing protein [Moniliophthora roreri MCA 2997]
MFFFRRHFQRLRKVKQLGTTPYVWPNASHNRFEHCLGVGHLARELALRLKTAQPELKITARDVDCVHVAGLCHDLGHGPWSHVFDSMFMPKAKPDSNWQHEQGSEAMFDDLIETRRINIPEDDKRFIKALIAGDPTQCNPNEKPFLFDIVANRRNGLDVDKFDYIVRDSLMVGHKVNLDTQRIIGSARVINNEICFDCKEVNNIYKIGENRFELHKMVYNHRAAKAIEYMIIDALLLADPIMKISDSVFDPKRYVHLTDSVMERIEESEDKRLASAQAIFARIHERDLYRLADFKCFPWKGDDAKYVKEKVTASAIFKTIKDRFGNEINEEDKRIDLTGLTEEEIIVDLTLMHYGMKDKNPLESVKFYKKSDPTKAFKARSGDYSTLRPNVFAEYKLQIYSKKSQYVGAIQHGYREVCESDVRLQNILMSSEDDDMEDVDEEDWSQRLTSPVPTEAPSTPRTTPLGSIENIATAKPQEKKKRTFSRVMSHNQTMTVPASYGHGSPVNSVDANMPAKRPHGALEEPVSPSPAQKKVKRA